MAIAVKSRSPSDTALKNAVRSAQFVGVYAAFSDVASRINLTICSKKRRTYPEMGIWYIRMFLCLDCLFCFFFSIFRSILYPPFLHLMILFIVIDSSEKKAFLVLSF